MSELGRDAGRTTITPPPEHGTGSIEMSDQERLRSEASLAASMQDLEAIINTLDSPATGLTAEQLIAQTAINVSDIDEQIAGVMRGMSARAAQGAALRAVTSDYQRALGAHEAYSLDGTVSVNGRVMTRAAALAEAGCTTQTIDDFRGHVDATNSEAFKSMLQSQTGVITEGSEVDTLRLQSLVSQRNQVLQMASQLIAAMNETDKGILSHIGR